MRESYTDDNSVKTHSIYDVVHSIDVENNEVRMSLSLWMQMTLKQKQGIVLYFSALFDSKGSTGRIAIRRALNDTKLASYSVWTGVKIYY